MIIVSKERVATNDKARPVFVLNTSPHINNAIPTKTTPPTKKAFAARLPAPFPLVGLAEAAVLAALLAPPLVPLAPEAFTAPKTPPAMLDGVPLLLTPDAADL